MHKGRVYTFKKLYLKAEILRRYYNNPLAGHFGSAKTIELIQRHYHWKGLQSDVKDYISSCAICQRTTPKRHKPYGELSSLPMPSRPFAELSMDFIMGLPPANYGFGEVDAILVIIDRYTKRSFFWPVRSDITAPELAELFHKEIELNYGAPEGIVSDRGPLFTSEFWGELYYYSKVKRRLSTAFHPQTDGQIERVNQVLEHYLRCFASS
jgi:hypothetical protein